MATLRSKRGGLKAELGLEITTHMTSYGPGMLNLLNPCQGRKKSKGEEGDQEVECEASKTEGNVDVPQLPLTSYASSLSWNV